mgnify:CR=1
MGKGAVRKAPRLETVKKRMWYSFPGLLRNIEKRTGAGAPNGSLV